MKYFDICTKKTFSSKGVEKNTWLKCGTMRITDEGHQFIELAMFPTTSFYVFEQKTKESPVAPAEKRYNNPDDIKWGDE